MLHSAQSRSEMRLHYDIQDDAVFGTKPTCVCREVNGSSAPLVVHTPYLGSIPTELRPAPSFIRPRITSRVFDQDSSISRVRPAPMTSLIVFSIAALNVP